MKIELKNIKYAKFASEETHCYEATVYFEGKRTGTVKNDGHGGCDYQYPSDKAVWGEMQAYIASLSAPTDDAHKAQLIRDRIRVLVDLGDAAYSENDAQESDEELLTNPRLANVLQQTAYLNVSLESICCDLLNQYLLTKDLKRLLKSRVLYLEGQSIYQTQKPKHPDVTLPRWITEISDEKPEAIILNRLAFSEALELYRKHA